MRSTSTLDRPRDGYDFQGKERFGPELARQVAARMSQNNRPGNRVRVYFCPSCRAWHIGHGIVAPPEERQFRRPRRQSERVVRIDDRLVVLDKF